MKKLQLNLDQLQIESFDTSPETSSADEGTVYGLTGSGEPEFCTELCTHPLICGQTGNTCGNTCGGTCVNTCGNTCNASCNGTCSGNTCGSSCGFTCGFTCGCQSIQFSACNGRICP